ncbi:NAD(P)-binding domain-containing protein [Corynebacterium sp.]|uniref:NAD(P)-binding domain-containing protein n=1 Tax=Corynebacterium sp. TaxID=1720 RepID=UPI00264A496F|nr:NAD(P)-binding domain-containing protein [Corynebacterium sp.]MDN5719730.1 NAD(P)-binding domain-containing protein [Corynebacterium sp.]
MTRVIPRNDTTLPERHRPEPLPADVAQANLDALAAQARADMALIGHNHDWVPAPAEDAYNVLVIGGGQAGLGAAFALSRHRIGGVKVIEAGPEQEVGCWTRYARMHTLRSPKNMKGIELDIPSLHTGRWFEAKYGVEAWAATDLTPREDWNEYLTWYRGVTGADVDFGTRITGVTRPDADGCFHITATQDGTPVEYRTRRIVFAMGLVGGGGTFLPPLVDALPENVRAHTEDDIDFTALQGKRVIVLGGGASGFDNASAALEAGAASVEMHVRRADIPRQNSLRWMEFPGMQEHFYDLTDEQKWEFSLFNGGLPQPPTQPSVWRAFSHDNFHLSTDTRWADAGVRDGEVVVTDDKGTEHVGDYVISATGYTVDLGLRPELGEFLPDIALWSDRFGPAEDHPLGQCPYLGDGFQFQAKDGGDGAGNGESSYVSRLFHLSTGARASHGVAGNQLSGIYAGLTRMSSRIATDITKENWSDFFADFTSFEHQEVGNVGRHREGEVWFAQAPRY